MRDLPPATLGLPVVVGPLVPDALLAVLADRYQPRPPRTSAEVPVAVASPPYHRVTRTYTGAALARRQAWGRQWAAVSIEAGKTTTRERV